jgi:hypothetical protein
MGVEPGITLFQPRCVRAMNVTPLKLRTEKANMMDRFNNKSEDSKAISLKGTWNYEINHLNPVQGDYVYMTATSRFLRLPQSLDAAVM